MSNYNLFTIVTNENGVVSIENKMRKDKNGTSAVVFDIPAGSAIADVDTFRAGMANAYNRDVVSRFYDKYVAPLRDKVEKDGLTDEEAVLLDSYTAIYEEASATLEPVPVMYSFLAAVWFGMKKGDRWSARYNSIIENLQVGICNQAVVEELNEFLNDTMKPYIREREEVKNFTARLTESDVKKLVRVARALTVKGTTGQGVAVKAVSKAEVGRQVLLYAIADGFKLWQPEKAKKDNGGRVLA